MTAKLFQDLKDELNLGLTETNHPFKCFTLGTVGLDNIARLRTVVLRTISDDLMLTFYTDKRSKKVRHITENNKVSLLFYHPVKMIQIKIEGVATIEKDQEKLKDLWKATPEHSKRDYTTLAAPGSSLKSYEDLEYLNKDHFLCIVHIEPRKIEYLKIEKPNHIRVRYSKDFNQWKGEYLVP